MVRVNVGENFKMTMEAFHTMIIKIWFNYSCGCTYCDCFFRMRQQSAGADPVGKPFAGGLRYTDRIAVGKPGE